MDGQGNTNQNINSGPGNSGNSQNPVPPSTGPIGNTRFPPAPGTIPRDTIKISDAIEAAEKNTDRTTSTIRTFQSDIADTVKNDNLSMIKISLAEKSRQDEQGDTYTELPQSRPKMKTAYFLTFILVLLIGGAVTGLYFYFNKPLPLTVQEIVAPNEPEMLYSEDQIAISIDSKDRNQLMDEIKSQMHTSLDLGIIKRIFLTTGQASSTKNTTTQDLFSILNLRANDSLRSALGANYVLGSYSRDPHETFILFKVTSYDSAFAGMMAWEPYMDYDIGAMLYQQIAQPAVATTAAEATTGAPDVPIMIGTSTQSSSETASSAPGAGSGATTSSDIVITPVIVAPIFKDKIMQNKDVRALIDSENKIRFLYSFLDTSTLVIASSERALKEVQARVTTGRIRR